MLYAAIAVCACLFAFGGQLSGREAVRGPMAGLSAHAMTLNAPDFPPGAFVMDEKRATETGVIRIRHVLATVGIVGLEGKVHPEDLQGIMRRAAARVTGEEPPARDGVPAPSGAVA